MFLVASLLFLLVLLGLYRWMLGSETLSQIERAKLSLLARVQADSAIQEVLAEVSSQANQSGTPLFRALRLQLGEDWKSLDLMPWIERPRFALGPTWGRPQATGSVRVEGEILESWARLEGPRSFLDPQGSEEYSALLRLGVRVGIREGFGRVQAQAEELFEVRMLRLLPPRPYDQLGVYVDDLEALFEPRTLGQVRARLLAQAEALRSEVQRARAQASDPELERFLGQIEAGIPPASELFERTPSLPPLPAALFGPYHVDQLPPGELDLSARLQALEARILAAETTARARSGPARADALHAWAGELSNGLDALWGALRTFTVLPHEGLLYRREMAPHQSRLEVSSYRARTTLEVGEGHPLFEDWRRGRGALEGVLDHSAAAETLSLSARTQGRVVLLVGREGIRLSEAGPKTSEDRLVVVSLGGDVEVFGHTQAAVLMLSDRAQKIPSGRFFLHPGARLVGSVVAPDARPGSLEIAGELVPDRSLRGVYPPKASARGPGPGDYLFAISPTALLRTRGQP